MITAAIIGGSGYTGGELLKILLFHPHVTIVAVTSSSHTGEKVSIIHPNLSSITNLVFEEEHIETLSQKVDVLFFALPAGESKKRIKKIKNKKVKIIDLSSDCRLWNKDIYGVYGLPEIYEKQIQNASLIANPGCFATTALLALFPLAKEHLLSKTVIINGVTGSSGSGIHPSAKTHHPERAYDFSAYGVFEHPHIPEIKQTIDYIQQDEVTLFFTPHSGPFVRGIFITAYVKLPVNKTFEEIKNLYKQTYQDKPFIRIVEATRVASVIGSNFCDIAIYQKNNQLIVTSAIDNLIKGASGQAVQNMNMLFGLPQTTGLLFPGLHP